MLQRSLDLRSVVLFGLAYLAPMIVLGTFGVLAMKTNGTVPTGYLLALVALFFTARSYGKMSARFPVAGSAYTYTRRAIDSRAGFLVGWAVLLDYFLLPMVIWLIGAAAFLSAKFPAVPKWTWIVGGGIFLVVTYSTQLVHPGGTFPAVSSAAFTIAKIIGGYLFSSLFLAGLVVTQFASGLSAQSAVARLLYAMGRDSVLPKRIFGYLQPRFHTPAINVVLSGVVGLIALKLDVATSTSFINFGAFSAFTCVNLCVIAMFIRQRREHGPSQRFVPNVVFPAIGAVVDVYLLLHLDGKAKLLGVIWLSCGVLYLTYLTRGFRRPPPEMEAAEE
jgi:putrescine importer